MVTFDNISVLVTADDNTERGRGISHNPQVTGGTHVSLIKLPKNALNVNKTRNLNKTIIPKLNCYWH